MERPRAIEAIWDRPDADAEVFARLTHGWITMERLTRMFELSAGRHLRKEVGRVDPAGDLESMVEVQRPVEWLVRIAAQAAKQIIFENVLEGEP